MTKSALIILAIFSLTTGCSPKLSPRKRLKITQQYILSHYKPDSLKIYINPKLVYRKTLMGHKIPFDQEEKSFTLGMSPNEIGCLINDKAIYDTLLLTIPEEYPNSYSYCDKDDYLFQSKPGLVLFFSPAFRTNKKNIYGIQSYYFDYQILTMDLAEPTDSSHIFVKEGFLTFGTDYSEFEIIDDTIKLISPIYTCDGTVYDDWKYRNIFSGIPPKVSPSLKHLSKKEKD